MTSRCNDATWIRDRHEALTWACMAQGISNTALINEALISSTPQLPSCQVQHQAKALQLFLQNNQNHVIFSVKRVKHVKFLGQISPRKDGLSTNYVHLQIAPNMPLCCFWNYIQNPLMELVCLAGLTYFDSTV